MLPLIKSVLNFSAFRPEPDDPLAAWKSRFPGRATALIHINRSSMTYRSIGRKGTVMEGVAKKGEIKDLFAELAHQIKDSTDDGWVVVSLDTRYVISVENNLSRKKGSEETLKKDPRSILHVRYEKGKRYSVTHNPETNSSLLLTCDEDQIKRIEGLCTGHGLKLGRLCCGTYVLLRHALTEINTKRGSDAPVSALVVACCGGSVCVLSQDKDNWIELRSRPDLYEGDLQPLLDLISPFAERIGAEAGLVLACDEPIAGLAEKLAEIFPGRALNDLTKPGLLADLLLQN